MKKLVIHIGPSKTASSTLQSHLSSATADLGDFVYPSIAQTRPDMGHHNLPYQLGGTQRYKPDVSGFEEFSEFLKTTNKNVFISSEDIFPNKKFLDPITKLCDEAGFDIDLMYFIRDPMDRLNSMYTQQIKTLAICKPFPEFLERASKEQRLLPFSFADRIRRGFPQINILLYPFIGRKIARYFQMICSRYGIVSDVSDFDERNISPSPEEIRFFLEHKGLLAGEKYWGPTRKSAQEYGFTRRFYGFTDELYKEYQEKFRPEYDRIGEFDFQELDEGDRDLVLTAQKTYDPSFDEDAYKEYRATVRRRIGL